MITTIQMKNKVLDIWSILKSERQSGLVKRLYSVNSKINIYCHYCPVKNGNWSLK